MKLIIALALSLTTFGQTYYLRNPATQPRYIGTAIATTTPLQITFDSAPGWSVGQRVFCNGSVGSPFANGFMKVKTAVSGTVFNFTDTSDVDIPASTTASQQDFESRTAGNQLIYCSAVTATTMNSGVLGWWPNSGAFATNFYDPDGAGASVSPVIALDATRWGALQTEAAALMTVGCDGSSALLCTVEEGWIASPSGHQLNGGWPPVILATCWAMDNSQAQCLNSAKYYLNNIHRYLPVTDFGIEFSACDPTAFNCGRGEDSDTGAFISAHVAQAYSLIRGQMTSDERTAFANKVFLDEQDGCENMLPALSGEINMAASSTTATGSGFSAYSVGQIIYIKHNQRLYKIDDGSLVSIAVSGTTGTVTIGSGLPLPSASTSLLISNSGVTGLDGSYIIAGPSGSTFTITVAGVSNGTYSAAGMTARSFAVAGSTGLWRKIASIASDTSMTFTTANGSTRIVNAPYSKMSAYTSSTCGIIWMTKHHAYAPVQKGARYANSAATVTPNATSIQLSTTTYDNFADIALPFYFGVGGEIMQATARNAGTRTLTVTRGAFLSPREQHTTNAIMFYHPHGPNMSLTTTLVERGTGNRIANLTLRKAVGIIMAAIPLLQDSAGANRAFEHYWNQHANTIHQESVETWAGQNPSGPGSPGYGIGVWIDMSAWLVLAARNSFNPSMDLTSNFPGLCKAAMGFLSTVRGDDHRYHFRWSDAGSVGSWETDEFKLMEAAASVCPTEAPYFLYLMRQVLPPMYTTHYETLAFALAYYHASETDYRSVLPRFQVWDESQTGTFGHSYMMGGASFRQSWTQGAGVTVGHIPVLQGGDHNGSYHYPGQLFLSKGNAELIGGSDSGNAWLTDHRRINGVTVRVTPTAESASGNLQVPQSYVPSYGPAYISRKHVGTNFVYTRVKNERYNQTAAVTSAHRDVVYMDAGTGGEDFVLVYDRVVTGSGREKNMRIPYFRGQSGDGTSVQSPAPSYSRTGDSVQFVSNQYLKSIRTKILIPSTGDATFTDDSSLTFSNRLSVATSANEAEFLVVHAPCGSSSCTEPTWAAITTSTTHRGAQITDNSGNDWIAVVAKDTADASEAVSYTATSYSGTAQHIVTGLVPSQSYTVMRDGSTLSTTSASTGGVIQFTASFGAGAFALTVGGTAPLEITTTELPNCRAGAAYNQTLAAVGGEAPYTWSVASGSLPTGLSLSSSGVLSGNCTASGTFNFTAEVEDSDSGSDTQAFTVTRPSHYYVSTTGSGSNDGTADSPFSRTSVMPAGLDENPMGLIAGDSVCFQAGTYDGPVMLPGFVGTEENPITFRPCTGATVVFNVSAHTILNGDVPAPNIQIQPDTSHVILEAVPGQGRFIITDTNTKRYFTTVEYLLCTPDCRPVGINDLGNYTQIRGLEFSNNGTAIASQGNACGSQYVGNIFYYGGWESEAIPDSAFGFPLYIQNEDPNTCSAAKLVDSNIMFAGVQQAIQIFGTSGSFPRNVQVTNNVMFNNGILAGDNDGGCIIVGGNGTALVEDNVISNNICFQTVFPTVRFDQFRIISTGSANCTDCTVSNNWVYGPSADVLEVVAPLTGLTETGNTFIGNPGDGAAALFPNSTFHASLPAADVAMVKWNPLNTDKGVAVLADGTGNGTVNLNPGPCTGSVELREMMNYTGPVLATVPCNASTAVTMAYAGDLLPIVGSLTRAPVHTGSTVRVFDLTVIPTSTLETSVRPGATTAVITMRSAGLNANQSCTATVYDADEEVAGSATSTAGAAVRTVVITGLTANTPYTYQGVCGSLSGSGSFTTLNTSGTATLTWNGKAPLSASRVKVSYRVFGEGSWTESSPTVCSSACSVTLPSLIKGATYEIRHDWLDGSNNVLYPSAIERMVVQ
jgi:hypothetical protein